VGARASSAQEAGIQGEASGVQTQSGMARAVGAALVLAQVCPARMSARHSPRPAPCSAGLRRDAAAGRLVSMHTLLLSTRTRCLVVSNRLAGGRLRHFRSTSRASSPYRARHVAGAYTAARGAEGRFVSWRRRREVRRRFARRARLLSARAPKGTVLTPHPWSVHRRR